MQSTSNLILYCCVLLIKVEQYHSTKLRIPIAGIFESGSESEFAFRYAIRLHNLNNSSKFLISPKSSISRSVNVDFVRRKICEHIEDRNVLAVFGGNMWYTISDIKYMMSELQVPFFTSETDPIEESYSTPNSESANNETRFMYSYENAKRSSPKQKANYLIHLRPSVMESAAHLIIKYNWTKFNFVCNTGEGLYRLQKIIEHIHEVRKDYVEIYVDIRFISDVKLTDKYLRQIEESESCQMRKNILVDLDTRENVEIFMKKVVTMGMNHRGYHYILTGYGLDEVNMEAFKYSGVNVTGFQIIDSESKKVVEFLRKYTEEKQSSGSYRNYAAALMVDAIKLFVNTINTMIEDPDLEKSLKIYLKTNTSCFTRDENYDAFTYGKFGNKSIGETFMKILLNENLTKGLTGGLKFTRNGHRDNTTIHILSMFQDTGVKEVGLWQDSRLNLKIPLWNNKGKENHTVRVVTILTEPFVKLKENKTLSGNDRYEGFAIDVIKEIAKMVGFEYVIHDVRDKKYGAETGEYFDNGTAKWDGMIGEILNGTADLAVAPLTISLTRARVVKFTEPFLTFGISIMIKKPGQTKPGIFSFLLPLSNSIWWFILAACLIVGCSLYAIAIISPFEWSYNREADGTVRIERDFTLFNSVWFSFAAFVQQGVDFAPKSPGARILSSTWWFFTLIMIAYYTANLAAFLTVTRIVTPINDWKDLRRYEETGIDFGPIKDGSTHQFFNKTKLTPFNELGQYLKKNQDKMVSNVKEGIAKVRNSGGKYALILESPENEYNNNQEPCDTMMVGQPFGDKGYGIASHMDFHLNDEINSAVLDLHENERLAEFYQIWWKDKGQCFKSEHQSASEALALINVAGAFYILSGGLFLALFTTLIEFYYHVGQTYKPYNSSIFSDYLHRKARQSVHGYLSDEKRCKELRTINTQSYCVFERR